MKHVFCFVLLFFISFLLFSEDFKVCIYPSNSEIKSYIEKYFDKLDTSLEISNAYLIRLKRQMYDKLYTDLDKAFKDEKENQIKEIQNEIEKVKDYSISVEKFDVKTVEYSEDIAWENLQNLDNRLLEYIYEMSDSDILILPVSSKIGDFTLLSLNLWSPLTKKAERIYMRLSQDSLSYTEECIPSLATLFLTDDEKKDFKIVEEEKIQSLLPEFNLSSSVPAKVFIDGVEKGETPIILNNLLIPSIITLKAEGYSQFDINVDGKTDRKTIELKPQWLDDNEYYSKIRKTFYRDFALTLGALGLNIGVKAINFENQRTTNILDMVTKGLLFASILNLAGSLFDYYTTADYLSQ